MKKIVKPLITVLLVAALLVPTVAMLVSNAATTFTVELAFDNLFVFDHWVTNGNSLIIDNDFGSTNAGSISDIDLDNGSFRFNNNTNHPIYTRAAAGTGEKTQENFDYYRMPVEEGASYSFSCNLSGTTAALYPFVFFYTESNEFTGNLIKGSFSGEGDHTFNFTVPEGAKYIQIRLQIEGNDAKNAYAVVKDIAISKYEFELDSTNLFSLDSWVGSEKSDQLASWVNYDDGRVTPKDSNSDGSYDQLYFETNVDSAETSGMLFTNFDYNSNSGYFSMDVKPNTDYTLSYNISAGNALDFQPYIVRYNSSGAFIDYINYVTTAYGVSNFTFTTTSATEYIAVVFTISHGNQSWNLTVQDIGVYQTYITDYTVDPVRETYSYNSSSPATYGTLPTPPAETYPENYVFAGWYTEKDGKGTRIAADTEILPQSMTVYPKFEPAVDTLTVKTLPAKTTYTVGEKINTTGLVLTYGINAQEDADGDGTTETVTKTTDISSGFYISPEYASSTAGTQTITVHYGGKTATFTVTVSDGDDKNIVVNGTTHAVKVANNNYTINYQAPTPFNRYEMTYFSDSYVKGEIVMDDVTEVFFLEPSNNGTFASYIDSFLRGVNHYNVDSIKFTCLDKEFGNFELLSLTTIAATVPSNSTQYYENAETGYKVGIDLSFGGVVSEVYDLNHPVVSRVYNIDGKNVTKVDYAERLDADYSSYTYTSEATNINLINKFDRGRYLQQSYYGTSQKPFEMGNYNGQDWPYNPVQGGNLVVNDENGNPIKGNEASKVIDYRITNEQIYIKTRPLDWGKNSVDYPDSYVTDSYMEAWYVFEDGMIKTYCRFVDYSGYPAHTRDQELPAVYIIEPLNHFVYNNVAQGSEWTTTNYEKIEEPDFWGVLPEYNALLETPVDPTVDCYESWAAFTASDNANSFGVGVYSAGVTDFHYGCFYPKYNETEAKNGNLVETENRHAVTTDPATENPTSYISPVDDMTFESYKPIEYSYYLTTGNADEIYTDFKNIAKKESQADLDKPKIAVPETVYMTPANGASTVGQYYVNNLLDTSNSYNIITEAERDAGMSIGLHIKDAATFSVKVTNVTEPSNDIFLCNTTGSEIDESTRLAFDATDTFINNTTYGLRFSGAGLQPGQKATAKWEITVYLDDGTTETYTAYTVMYAPGRTVGAVAEARQVAASQNEISSWITGANGVDHSIWSPLGSLKGDYKGAGYFTNDPLYNENAPSGGSGGDATDYIEEQITGADVDNNVYNENNYVMQTATNDHDSSRARSYLGLLTVDKSRYTNTNQIPNLEIGFDALRIGSYEKNSIGKYTTYYTLGTESSYTATSLSEAPSGWTVHSDYTDLYSVDGVTIPYRERVIPSFDVSTIDGKYIHALNQAKADQTINTNQYSTAGTSVLCSVTDKSALRDTVMDGYGMNEEDYTEDSYNKFLEELEDAATVLGDPSASQDEIDQANKKLTNVIEKMTEVYYALKYDNLFSAYEFSQFSNSMTVVGNRGTVSYNDGTLTVVNDTITGGEAYTQYGTAEGNYLIDLKPNTEYVFEYTSETTLKAQAFMFFYNSSGGAGDVPTNMSIKVNNGNWSPKSESNAWWGNYQNDAGTNHYAIKFTTGANTTKAGFRFGNTSNDPVTSTFSNIKLIDAAHYYEDVEYTKTEDVYKKYASYGTLPTLTRTGYTFGGWADADGNTVTGATIAEQHLSIFSQWTEHSYTIVYNSNGGSGTIAGKTVKYTDTVALASSGFTRSGYTLLGWATDPNATSVQYQLGQNVSKLTDANGETVTLYAVWASAEMNITFDNILNMKSWQNSASFIGNANITDKTNTGFSVSNKANESEKTVQSTLFGVTAGKQYKIDIDITGNNWDVYIFFYGSDSTSGTGLEFTDSGNRYSADGSGNSSQIFTAPANATSAAIRVDANQTSADHTVIFENIRVYEYDGISPIDVEPSNRYAYAESEFGTLPTPTKEGFNFVGWVDEYGNTVNADSIVPREVDGVVSLTSKWQLADSALTKDTAVLDFSSPIEIDAYGNDTILQKASTAYNAKASITGVSVDGVTYSETVNGNYGVFNVEGEKVTYTPTSVINGVENIYYQAQLSAVDTTPVENQITIVPASNILYEETVASNSGSGKAWSSDGTSNITYQTASTGNDVYGYDASYLNNDTYSGGTAETVVLDYYSSRSATKTFEVTGDAFDLISACGKKTGAQIVTVRDSLGKIVKVYIVDTYYSDASIIDSDTGILYQVPIVSFRGDYDTYSVEVTAAYLTSAMAFRSSNGAVATYAVEADNVEMEASAATVSDKEAIAEILAEVGMEDLADENVELVWFDDDSIFNGGTGAFLVSEPVTEAESVQMMATEDEQLSCRVTYNWGTDSRYIPSTETLPDSFDFSYDKGQTLTSGDIDSKYKSSTIVKIDGEDGVWKFSGWTIPNKGVIKTNPVVVTGKWTFYPELNYCFDSIRVYNPMQDTSSYVVSEQNAVYSNVINSLAGGDIFTDVSGIAYVEGSTFENASFAEYQNKGPQNELYLTSGNSGVSFSVPLPEGAKVMLGVRAVSGSPKLTINGIAFEIKTATEMYYDITGYLTATDGVAPIAVTNTGSGVLAVNNIKFIGIATASVNTLSLDQTRALMAMKPVDVEYTLPGVSEPEQEEPTPDTEGTIPDTDGDSDDNGTTDWLETAINNIRDFFSDVFGNIKRIFELIISFITTKEVF